jgi:hypothetical protein
MAGRGAQLYTMRDHLKDANAFANTIDRPYDPAAAKQWTAPVLRSRAAQDTARTGAH